MIRGVPLLLVCACVARAVPQGGNSAAPDSGAGAVGTGGPTSDAGSGASGADAGSISGGYDAGTAQAIDAGAWNPDATATLLDSDVISIAGVSADEQRLLVSRTYPPSDMELVTVGTPAVTLTSGTPYTSARFSPDGRSILLLQPSAIQDDATLTLIRGDGTAARQLTSASRWAGFAGRWLYYDDESGADEVLYRLLPPDGDPQVIASFPPPHAFPGASLDYSTSPDGESVLYCHSPSGGVENCFLTSPVSASLPVPGWVRLWAPNGRWVTSGGCTLIDATGASRQVCDPQLAAVSAVSRDGSMLALLGMHDEIHLYSLATGKDTVVPMPPFTDASYRPSYFLCFTPDGSRLIAFLGQSAFTMPVAGGSWTEIVSDNPPAPHRGNVEVSPDSRIVAAWSDSQGLKMSIDGAPARVVFDSSVIGVGFEPAGGLGKAFFYRAYDNEPLTIANADGSDARDLPPMNCEWKGRTALCLRWSNTPYQTILLSDEGQQLSVLTHDTSNYGTTAQLTQHRLFYIGAAGGLYVLEYRKP